MWNATAKTDQETNYVAALLEDVIMRMMRNGNDNDYDYDIELNNINDNNDCIGRSGGGRKLLNSVAGPVGSCV